LFSCCKFYPEILTGSAERGRQTRVGWGKQALFVDISKTVRNTTKVTTNDYQEVAYALSTGTKVDDLELL